MKPLMICNTAPHYRAAIFQALDREIGCDFVIGDKVADIKKMDYSVLTHKVTEVKNVRLVSGYYQKGVPKLVFSKQYDTYLITGDTRCVSTWLFLILALFFPKKRVYLWSHGWLGNESKMVRFVSKLFYGLASGTFIYNNRSRQLMIEGGLNGRKLTTVYNSLDYDTQLALRENLRFSDIYSRRFGNNNKVLVFIGRLTLVKRLDLILDAVSLLRQRNQFFNVVFIGDGVVKDELEQKVKDLKIQDFIWFYGASYDENKNAELLYNADLCVSPGNIGLTAMHALMFGCPCLTNDDYNNQMPEFEAIQDGITGCFFKVGDATALAEGIELWFVEHGENRKTVQYNCFKMIDEIWNFHNQIRIIKEVLKEK